MSSTAHTVSIPMPVSIGREAVSRAQSRARKSELLLDATRQFCGLSRPTRNETVMYKELFYQLIYETGKPDRRSISAMIARNPYVPRTIAYCLALDDDDIAAPVLMFCPLFGELDILQLVRRLSPVALEILCRRTDLSPSAVKVLISQGGEKCRTLIARNPAVFENEAIQVILSGIELPPPPQTVAVAEGSPSPSPRQQLLDLAARGGQGMRPEKREQPKARIEAARPFEPQLLRLLRTESTDAVAAALHGWCGIEATAVTAILERGGTTERAALLRGLGMGVIGAMQCMLLLDTDLGRNISNYSQAKQVVASLAPESCLKIVESLGGKIPQLPVQAAAQPSGNVPFARRREESPRQTTTDQRQTGVSAMPKPMAAGLSIL